MEKYLLFASIICVICIFSSRISNKIGVPTLLIFIILGMMFGTDGIFKIDFSNYELTEKICSIALIFIMFYGGFCTNWKAAKPFALKAILLSTLGVFITAMLTGLFCYFILNTTILESMLIGSVIASTDAASVFSILRMKKLNLVNGLASILEIESGSNDPMAYMLTMIFLNLMSNSSKESIPYMLFSQIIFGLFFGFIMGKFVSIILRKVTFNAGLQPIFVGATAIFTYSITSICNGNGFLSVYICGIIMGNSKILYKKELVQFFDGITAMMQIVLFFLLGLLSFPSHILHLIVPSVCIALFLTIVARPLAIFILLSPFKVPINEQLLISWAGLRGAASIVFAIYTVINEAYIKNDIFHIVFCISLLSVAIQGTLLPLVSKKLNVIDDNMDISKTFNDYQEENTINLIEIRLLKGHPWIDKTFSQISMPLGMLAVMIKRKNYTIVPKGDTMILKDDIIVLNCNVYKDSSNANVKLSEIEITKKHPWINKYISEIDLPKDSLVVMIKRGNNSIIPGGDTYIEKNDLLVICNAD